MIDPFNIETSTYAGNVIYKAQLHIFNTAYIETYYPDIAITDLRIAESSFYGYGLNGRYYDNENDLRYIYKDTIIPG